MPAALLAAKAESKKRDKPEDRSGVKKELPCGMTFPVGAEHPEKCWVDG